MSWYWRQFWCFTGLCSAAMFSNRKRHDSVSTVSCIFLSQTLTVAYHCKPNIDKVHTKYNNNSRSLKCLECHTASFTRKNTITIFNYNIENNSKGKCSTFNGLGIIFKRQLTSMNSLDIKNKLNNCQTFSWCLSNICGLESINFTYHVEFLKMSYFPDFKLNSIATSCDVHSLYTL